MTTTRYIIIIVLVTSTILLSGCKLSASTPPAVTETPDSAMSTLEAELANIATQTHVAGGGVESVPTDQPAPESTTATSADTAPAATPETSEPAVAQPTPTPAPVFNPTPGLPQTYQIQKGEFPFCISRRFNVNQTEVLNLNGLSTSSLVPVGFALKIPQTGNTFYGQRALLKHPANYTVVAGDTIYTVACKYGDIEPLAIAQANSLDSPYTLTAGQVLHIP